MNNWKNKVDPRVSAYFHAMGVQIAREERKSMTEYEIKLEHRCVKAEQELTQARLDLTEVRRQHQQEAKEWKTDEELRAELAAAKADVAALYKDVMPRSEFLDLLGERDALKTWRDECCAAWKERDAAKADADRFRTALEKLAQLGGGRSEGNSIAQHALNNATPAAPVVPSEPLMGLDFVRWVPLADAEALAKALEHALPFIRSTIGLGAYGSLVEANEVHSTLTAFRAKHPPAEATGGKP